MNLLIGNIKIGLFIFVFYFWAVFWCNHVDSQRRREQRLRNRRLRKRAMRRSGKNGREVW